MHSLSECRLESNNNVKITFDGGDLSSDGGLLLLKDFLHQFGVPELLNRVLMPKDLRRAPIHRNGELLLQAIVQVIAGYFSDDSADILRKDPVFKEILGKKFLASQPTMSRFYSRLGLGDGPAKQLESIEKTLRKRVYSVEMPDKVVFDMDTTLFQTYGHQLEAAFNAHYQAIGYHPFVCYDGITGDLLLAVLRGGADYCCKDAASFMEPLLKEYCEQYPGIKRYARGDSGFATPELYDLFEKYSTTYVIRLKENPTLVRLAGDIISKVRAQMNDDWISPRAEYGEFRYQAGSWDHDRRVVVKVQKPSESFTLQCMFIVTNDEDSAPKEVIDHYCARGNMENFIKESKNGFDFKTVSSLFMAENAARLQMHAIAYNIFNWMKRLVFPEKMRGSQVDTVRLHLFKTAVRLVHHGRKQIFRMATSCMCKDDFLYTLNAIQRLEPQIE